MYLRNFFNKIDRQLRPWRHYKKIETNEGTKVKKDGVFTYSPEAEKLINRYARNLVIIIISILLVLLLIALFLVEPVGAKTNSAQHIERFETSMWLRLTVNDDRLIALLSFIPAEVACLVAIARGSTGTGLFLLSLFGVVNLALILTKRISNRL